MLFFLRVYAVRNSLCMANFDPGLTVLLPDQSDQPSWLGVHLFSNPGSFVGGSLRDSSEVCRGENIDCVVRGGSVVLGG